MNAFCIFDDFPSDCVRRLEETGINVTMVEKGQARPTDLEMMSIFEKYEVVIIGTSQKIYEWMWKNVTHRRIVATASVGTDHITVPKDKEDLLTILNAPLANSQSVGEYTVGAMLMTRKRFWEGNALYAEGRNNKNLLQKPEDIHGTTVGLIGAGCISTKIMELLKPFGVRFLCYTKNPNHHVNLTETFGTEFVDLETLAEKSDIISVNVPYDTSTENLINASLIAKMKKTCIFISIARAQVLDVPALIERAEKEPNFYVVLDLDVISECVGKNNGRNIVLTPHIAGGTIETRKRMFSEVTERLIKDVN